MSWSLGMLGRSILVEVWIVCVVLLLLVLLVEAMVVFDFDGYGNGVADAVVVVDEFAVDNSFVAVLAVLDTKGHYLGK